MTEQETIVIQNVMMSGDDGYYGADIRYSAKTSLPFTINGLDGGYKVSRINTPYYANRWSLKRSNPDLMTLEEAFIIGNRWANEHGLFEKESS